MNKTAALLIIGNEILSGRTKDANLNHIAQKLTDAGIVFMETRIIPDDESRIMRHVRELSESYDYVFTTGGIGSTHDDITSQSIAKAFDLPFICNEEAYQRLRSHYGNQFTDVRGRMAFMPEGAMLIDNPLTIAPGFCIQNVYVMAGVPAIMQAMFEHVLPLLTHGKPIQSETVVCHLPESLLARDLENIQKKYSDLSIGSYPGWKEEGFQVHLVVRGTDVTRIKAAAAAIATMVTQLEKNFGHKRA